MAGHYMWNTARNEEYKPATTEGFSRKNKRQETTWEFDS